MEGYAVAELAARADAMAAGLGGLVGELVALAGELTGPAAAQLSFDEIEQQVIARGREVLRMTVQYVMDARAAAEPRRAEVAGADGVRRRRAERGHARTVVTWFGPVIVRRLAYRAPGAANLYPADAVLNLPVRRYSWAVQQAAVRYALAGSYEQAQLLLQAATGVSIGKQQLEQILAEAAGTRRGSARPGRPRRCRRGCRWRSRRTAREWRCGPGPAGPRRPAGRATGHPRRSASGWAPGRRPGRSGSPRPARSSMSSPRTSRGPRSRSWAGRPARLRPPGLRRVMWVDPGAALT